MPASAAAINQNFLEMEQPWTWRFRGNVNRKEEHAYSLKRALVDRRFWFKDKAGFVLA